MGATLALFVRYIPESETELAGFALMGQAEDRSEKVIRKFLDQAALAAAVADLRAGATLEAICGKAYP